jgi:hypothetical protein
MFARLSVLVLLVLFSWTARAQRIDPATVSSSGGFMQASGASVSWTVGQTAVDMRSAHFGTLSEGFQHAFLTVIPIREQSIPLTLDLYPNPARTSLLVNLQGHSQAMTLVLYDLLGQPVLRQQLREGDTMARLPFNGLSSGMYLLVAFSGSGEQLALYKVVKAD